ncbi:multicopper oxidase family protein [uncultured Aliiroseovarius sp.]|uniref:multicopper oxidase family protein n=1 Tax=uncultured Aliiroseovarius sp. TaxID=1658783 RepID=UPI002595545B|nr:multicopper oxidase family protein [uncultured Aliiroseovarius sp.]
MTFALAGTRLSAAPSELVLAPQEIKARFRGQDVSMLGFNGGLPGPEIRVRQGQNVQIILENRLDEGALVHWHGLRVPNRMDGVNVLTQDVVIPGDSYRYQFGVPDAGTYWYHSHYLSYEQVGRGLFGAFIVEEKNVPAVDHDIVVQFFDVLLDEAGQYEDEFNAAHFSTEGRIGNLVMADVSNGTGQIVKRGDRLRLRLINPSIDRVYRVSLDGLEGKIVALDGMPLAHPRALEPILLAPGQRCDVIGDATGPIRFDDSFGERTLSLGVITVSGSRDPAKTPITALPANRMPAPKDPGQTAELVLQGGAGSASHSGTATWALNDVSGLPRTPFLSVAQGTTARISIRNETEFPHVMHLHGHHFWELDAAGEAGPYRDSIYLDIGETQDILVVLDNPGSWMLHCHMLSHQADGMATWIKVG